MKIKPKPIVSLTSPSHFYHSIYPKKPYSCNEQAGRVICGAQEALSNQHGQHLSPSITQKKCWNPTDINWISLLDF